MAESAPIALTDLSYQRAIATRTPEQTIAHLQQFSESFEPRFSAGDWFAAEVAPLVYTGPRKGDIRFHRGYRQPMELSARFDMYGDLKEHGLVAVEAHYHPQYGEITEDNLDLWQQFHQESGLRIRPALNAHFDERSEWGSLSSPYATIRKQAVGWLGRTLQIANLFGEDSATVWPGIEGYEHPMAHPVAAARSRFTDSVAEAMDNNPGIRVSGEMKPFEPRINILYGTSPDGLLFAYDVEAKLRDPVNTQLLGQGIPLVVFGPEIGHMKMVREDVAGVFQMYASKARLNHTHWNAHGVGELDWDLNPGQIAIEDMDHGIYALMMIGYEGLFGIDIDPIHMDTRQALLNSMDAIKVVADRLNNLDHERVILAAAFPHHNRGTLEQLMTRSRAHPTALGKLSAEPEWTEPQRDLQL